MAEEEKLTASNSDVQDFGRVMNTMLRNIVKFQGANQEEFLEQEIEIIVGYLAYLKAAFDTAQAQKALHYPKTHPIPIEVEKTKAIPDMQNEQWARFCYAFARVRDEIVRSNSTRMAHRFSIKDAVRMENWNSSAPMVTNCIFTDNSATYGGGMSNLNSSPTVTNCTFSNNLANQGGGMYTWCSSPPRFNNCILGGDADPNRPA